MSQDSLFAMNAGFATATYTSTDPDEFASLSRAEIVDVIDTGPGPFHASVTRVNLNRIWMQRGSESVPFLARIKHPAERIGISFLKPTSAQSMLQATIVSNHDLAMLSLGHPDLFQISGKFGMGNYIAAGRRFSYLWPDIAQPRLSIFQARFTSRCHRRSPWTACSVSTKRLRIWPEPNRRYLSGATPSTISRNSFYAPSSRQYRRHDGRLGFMCSPCAGSGAISGLS